MPRKKRQLTLTEFARLGGQTLQANRTPEERSEAGRRAAAGRWKKYRERLERLKSSAA